jgi:hypothetical protein
MRRRIKCLGRAMDPQALFLHPLTKPSDVRIIQLRHGGVFCIALKRCSPLEQIFTYNVWNKIKCYELWKTFSHFFLQQLFLTWICIGELCIFVLSRRIFSYSNTRSHATRKINYLALHVLTGIYKSVSILILDGRN